MRLKDIKHGMAIYCTRRDQIAEIRKTGIRGLVPIDIEMYMIPPCYVIIHRNYATWEKDRENVKKLYPSIKFHEFYDMILESLSAEEVLQWLFEYEDTGRYADCFGINYDMKELKEALAPREIVEKVSRYVEMCKYCDEPDFEWVDVCRIIKVHDNGKKECVEEIPVLKSVSEGFAEWQLKEYCKEHEGDYIAVVERVCRVKQ